MEITELLDKYGVEYKTSGKNISNNWIGMACVYCGDTSTHLGINLRNGSVNCFRCGKKSLNWTLHLLLKVSYSKAKQLAKGLDFVREREGEGRELEISDERIVHFNTLFSKFQALNEQEKKYLESRRFDPSEIEKIYGVRGSGNNGGYKFRIIAPILYNNQVVNFVGRDVTDRHQLRYKFCKVEDSIISRENLVYNLHRVKDRVVIVEGVTDVWRCGDGFVSTFGVAFSNAQILQITKALSTSKKKRVFVMYDAEERAQERGQELSFSLTPYFSEVINIDIGGGRDPGDLTTYEVKELRRELFR